MFMQISCAYTVSYFTVTVSAFVGYIRVEETKRGKYRIRGRGCL